VYLAPPLKGFPWSCVYRRSRSKSWNDGVTGTRKKFDDIFRLLHTMHERDGRTDRQTSADSKDRAYA